MQYHDLMQRLGVELRLPELVPDAAGECAFSLDGMAFTFRSDARQGFTLSCPLGEAFADSDEVFEALLASNLFADGVGGSALGVDANNQVYLTQRFHPDDLSFPRFVAALERFANLAEFWQDNLASRTLPSFEH